MRKFAAFGLAILASCSQGPAPGVDQGTSLNRALLDVARSYTGYGKLIDWRRWSPLDCRAPSPTLERSRSGDDLTHGRKLYYLFARDENAYHLGRTQPQPDGQAIVKEAWEPRQVGKGEGAEIAYDEPGKQPLYFKAGARSALFIMLKQQGTWVYATVSADGKTVTQSGQIESCLGCHKKAPHDSLFGDYMAQRDPPLRSR